MNKKYFNYLFKSKKSLGITVVISYLIVFISCLLLFNGGKNSYIIPVIGITAVLGFLCYIIVPIVFNFIHSKKAVDSYFSLPVTRKELLITSETYICLLILVPYTILMIVALFYGLSTGGIDSLITYFSVMLFSVIGSIAIVMFNTAIYLKANSVFDGALLIAAYAILPLFLLIPIETFQNEYMVGYSPIIEEALLSYISLPASLIIALYTKATILYEHISIGFNSLFSLKFYICVIWHVVVSIYVFNKDFIKRKVERAENISNDFFSYPFIIYAYVSILAFSLTLSLFRDFHKDTIILYVVIFIAFLIANFVYRRKIKIVLKDVLFFLLTILVSFGFSYYANKTHGFGLSHLYEKNPSNLVFSYHEYKIKDFDAKDEIIDLLNSKGYETDYYEIEYDVLIKNNELESKKAAYDFIEKKRAETIDNFYNKDKEYYYSGSLIIKTNVDETLDDEDLYKVVSNGNKCCVYTLYEPLSLDELSYLSSIVKKDVAIAFYENGNEEKTIVTLSSLLKK